MLWRVIRTHKRLVEHAAAAEEAEQGRRVPLCSSCASAVSATTLSGVSSTSTPSLVRGGSVSAGLSLSAPSSAASGAGWGVAGVAVRVEVC